MTINSALTLAYNQLTAVAGFDDFWGRFDTAFGTNYDRTMALTFQSQWLAGDFSLFSTIEVVSDQVLGTANGAYGSNNTIYVSEQFLSTASKSSLVALLLEEYGHFVDAQINSVDSAGDEGSIFAALVQGQSLDTATLQVLKAEDDSAIITIAGENILVEQNTLLDPTSFTLNGSSQFTIGADGVSTVLRLTDDYSQNGSSFLTNAISLSNNASFSTYFEFQITDSQDFGDGDGAGADGLVFVIQTLANNVGGNGSGLGFEGIPNSLGIEFDTYDNGEINGNHVGVDINGDINSVASQPVTNRLNNGNIWSAWVDYNGVSNALEVRISENNQRPTTAFLSYTVDLLSVLGQTDAFIGFTSGTGLGTGDHDILDWQFNSSYNPIGDVTLAVSPSSVFEDGTVNFVYTFTRTGDLTNPLTANYTITGTATNTDYTGATPGTGKTITFAAGSATAILTIDPTVDTTIESNETIVLTLATGTGYTVGTTTAVTGTITNDDSPTLSINDITVVEGKDTNAFLTISLSDPITQAVSVNYTTTAINATAGSDYTTTSGTLTLAPNSTLATISIPILNDDINESLEAFTVTLSNPVNAKLSTNTNDNIGEVTISDTWYSGLTSTLPNGVENLTLIGINAINGTGNSGNNILTGNSANNTLDGSTGVDTLIGGFGNDIYQVDSTIDIITENAGEGIDTIQSSVTYTIASLANIENLTLTGSSVINGTGNAANNILTGNIANNTLDGSTGVDTLIGGFGNDIYQVDSTTDIITENAGEGIDTIQSSVTYTISSLANIENLTLTGSSVINGTGNAANNSLTGNTANNTLNGSDGNDTLNGGAGNDTLIGGNGNDYADYYSSTASVTVNLAMGTANDGLGGTDTLSQIENVQGSNTAGDNLTGDANNNTFYGYGGNDTLNGGDGNDLLIGGTGNDSLIGGNGTDIAYYYLVTGAVTANLATGIASDGEGGTDTLSQIENIQGSNTAGDNLTGNTGVNVLYGYGGADILTGGGGNDLLSLGSDTVKDTVNYASGDGVDTVYNFVRGAGGDLLKFTSIAAIDVQVSGTNTLFKVGDGISGNSGFGSGTLLLTTSATTGFVAADVNVNLLGATFAFS